MHRYVSTSLRQPTREFYEGVAERIWLGRGVESEETMVFGGAAAVLEREFGLDVQLSTP